MYACVYIYIYIYIYIFMPASPGRRLRHGHEDQADRHVDRLIMIISSGLLFYLCLFLYKYVSFFDLMPGMKIRQIDM